MYSQRTFAAPILKMPLEIPFDHLCFTEYQVRALLVQRIQGQGLHTMYHNQPLHSFSGGHLKRQGMKRICC